MKNAVYLFITIIFLSSCQKEESIELSQTVEPVGNRKLSLITLKWGDKYNNPPTLGSIYYKITYDTINNKIFLDTDSTNMDHEYVYEYNDLGQLVKCKYPDAMNNNQSMVFTYTRTDNALTITSNSQGIIENRVYNKTVIPGGYRLLQTVANPSGHDYSQFDFTNQHIPIQDIHFDGDIMNPFNYDKRVYTFNNFNYESCTYYNNLNDPGSFSGTIVRGNGSTKLVYDFIKELRGSDFLYFWGYDTDNFLGLTPERLGISLFNEVNFSNKEIIGSIPASEEVIIKNTFYNFGEIKSTLESFPGYEEQRNYFYE